MLSRFRPFFLFCILILIAWVEVTPAQAHALLLRSIPDENALLAHSPSQVELFFSEPVDPKLSKLNVLDLGENVVDKRDGRVDPADGTHMVATLNPLSHGVVLEMTTNIWKMHDLLAPYVRSVTVVHPAHVALIVRAERIGPLDHTLIDRYMANLVGGK
jgi:methionine-rich copper-binding protein CopC